jgi:hypothetical protein
MKNHFYAILLISLALLSCESFQNKKLFAFRKVNVDNVPKLVKIEISKNSSDEGSDYWNNYFISVFDAKTGVLEKNIKFTVDDARLDKGQLLDINDKYIVLLNDTYTLIDLQTEKIYRGKGFEKFIEDKNIATLKNKIGSINSFSQNFISLTTKQGNSYVLSLKSLSIYQANVKEYWQIPDSLNFNYIENSTNLSASNQIHDPIYLADEERGYSLEDDKINTSKSFLYEYEIKKMKYKSSKSSEFESITIYDTLSYSYQADFSTKKQLSSKPYIYALFSKLADDKIYIQHRNEVSDNPKYLFSCFDIKSKNEKFNIELPLFKEKQQNNYGIINWQSDKKYFFYSLPGSNEPIYEFDAADGKLLMKY